MSIRLNLTDTITFERPLTRVVKQNIRIENPHSSPIAFKVKTTAPRLYCVRPNAEIIPPGGYKDVQIMLQAFREEPAPDARCKDKFLILSTFARDDMNVQEIWNQVETIDKASIKQHKLRCVYGPVNQVIGNVNATTPAVSTNTTETIVQREDVNEKMRQMQEELEKYKRQVEDLREADPAVVEKSSKIIKQTSSIPFGIIIFLALLVAAIAYFVKSSSLATIN